MLLAKKLSSRGALSSSEQKWPARDGIKTHSQYASAHTAHKICRTRAFETDLRLENMSPVDPKSKGQYPRWRRPRSPANSPHASQRRKSVRSPNKALQGQEHQSIDLPVPVYRLPAVGFQISSHGFLRMHFPASGRRIFRTQELPSKTRNKRADAETVSHDGNNDSTCKIQPIHPLPNRAHLPSSTREEKHGT